MTAVLHDLLRRAAERAPDALAVDDAGSELTYRQLDERSNRLARLLVELGAGPGERVGLFLDKSSDAVVAIYGILKAGAAYVPIDPRSPAGRASRIAADAGLCALVTGVPQASVWPELIHRAGVGHLVVPGAPPGGGFEAPAGVTVHTAADLAHRSAEPLAGAAGRDDLAYILYTSGSTGVPKGVMLTHGNALAFVEWAVAEFGVRAADRLASIAPLHFDLSVFDLYAAAATGASVHLLPPGAASFPSQLARFARDQRITVWYSVPSALTMLAERGGLAERGLPDLRVVLFAGEVFPAKHLRRLMELVPQAEYANLYGPTETNVCTFHRVEAPPEPGGDVPIGIPITGVTCRVVGDDGSLVGAGQTGELLVGGPVVMRGYWADPDKTAASLVADPIGPPGQRCYRTGDLVVADRDGRYHLIGRRDHQIKSRGYRIELGEVEATLISHPAVAECAVVAVPDERITNRIEAFVVTSGCADTGALLCHCRAHLPTYMVPHRLTVLDELPRTSTGKVDRRALTSEH